MDLSLDSRSLGVFRISLGLVALSDLFDRSRFINLYTDQPILCAFPRPTLMHWSFHALTGSATGQAIWFLLAAICLTAFTVGFQTRIATVLSFALTLSLQNRNPYLQYGADDVLRLMLLWSCFLPLETSYSIDHWKNPRAPQTFKTPAAAALIAQIAAIFLFAGLHKWSDPTWRSGAGLELSVRAFPGPLSAIFTTIPVAALMANWAIMVFQIAGALCALSSRFRIVAVVGFTAVHLGMAATMDLGFFPFVVVASCMALVPSWVWGDPTRVTIFGRRPLTAALLTGLILPLTLEVAENSSNGSGVIATAIGLGVRQHWRMFTPPPHEKESLSAVLTDDDLEWKNFIKIPSPRLWSGSRWGNLSVALGQDEVVAHGVFQFFCERRAPATAFRLERVRQNITQPDQPAVQEPLVQHRCAN